MHLFAYGTLMVPQIWRIVTGRTDRGVPGVLRGYRVRRVQGDLYPVMLRGEREDEIARGLIYNDLDPLIWRLLDEYESNFYQRIAVEVSADDRRLTSCQAYVLQGSQRELASDDPWELDWFEREAMQKYLRRFA